MAASARRRLVRDSWPLIGHARPRAGFSRYRQRGRISWRTVIKSIIPLLISLDYRHSRIGALLLLFFFFAEADEALCTYHGMIA